MKLIIIILTIFSLSCSKKTNTKERLELVNFKGCQYVLWHNNYGSDMEHHEHCNNPKHNEEEKLLKILKLLDDDGFIKKRK